jgi:hypothetical protein
VRGEVLRGYGSTDAVACLLEGRMLAWIMDTAGELSCGLRDEGQEGRAACLGEVRVLEPMGNADKVEGGSRESILELGLGQAM